MSSFGPIESERVQLDREHPTLKKALAMMIPLATQFCQNELAKKDLKAARDRVMKKTEEGCQRQAIKRPASSTPVDLTESQDNNKEKRKEPAKVAKTSDDKASKKEKGQHSCSYEPMCDMPSALFDSLSCLEEARRF